MTRYVVLSTYAIEKEISHYDFRVYKLETFFGESNINKQSNLVQAIPSSVLLNTCTPSKLAFKSMYTVNHGAISCFGRLNQFCFKVLNSGENSRLKDTDDIVYEITHSLNNANNSF